MGPIPRRENQNDTKGVGLSMSGTKFPSWDFINEDETSISYYGIKGIDEER